MITFAFFVDDVFYFENATFSSNFWCVHQEQGNSPHESIILLFVLIPLRIFKCALILQEREMTFYTFFQSDMRDEMWSSVQEIVRGRTKSVFRAIIKWHYKLKCCTVC